MSAYPPPTEESAEMLSRPRIIVDMHGVILAWYLPDVLPEGRQVSGRDGLIKAKARNDPLTDANMEFK